MWIGTFDVTERTSDDACKAAIERRGTCAITVSRTGRRRWTSPPSCATCSATASTPPGAAMTITDEDPRSCACDLVDEVAFGRPTSIASAHATKIVVVRRAAGASGFVRKFSLQLRNTGLLA